MTRLLFAIPGNLSARTGGYEYDRRILHAAPGLGLEAVHVPLPGSFPNPPSPDIAETVAILNRTLRRGDVIMMDGLAAGALPETALREIAAPVIELCHHPLYLEAGLAPARAAELRENEGRALAFVAHVVVTSAHTGATLEQDFGVPRLKISVAPPGTECATRARGTRRPMTILAVGSLIPRKAFDILVDALSKIADVDWRLDIVGNRALSPETASALERQIGVLGLQSRISLLGERSGEALKDLFYRADIFVSSSLYEGYGMALAEALARGLPIVMTTGGAASETVADDAAVKVTPGDTVALQRALREVMANDARRDQLSDGAWRAGQTLPRWEDAAKIIVEAARGVAARAT